MYLHCVAVGPLSSTHHMIFSRGFSNLENVLAPWLLGVDATNKKFKHPHHHNKHAGSNENDIIANRKTLSQNVSKIVTQSH